MNALRGRTAFDAPALTLDEAGFTDAEAAAFKRVVLVGMGTSLFAAQLGALYIEELARVPATAEDASEFRYRRPALDRETLVVAVAQSGETADTLEAMHAARAAGARLLAVVNAEGSQATHVAHSALLLRAGPEIAVASTKTFTNALVCLLLTALDLGQRRGVLDGEAVAAHVGALAHLPALLGESIALNEGAYPRLAARYGEMRRFLYVGRGRLLPIALEGAMKLKEVSYIHAEGMSAAMMKHGPIALVDRETPVVALAPAHGRRDKMLGNINEVAAREGPVLAVATEGDEEAAALASDVLWTPPSAPLLEPIRRRDTVAVVRLPRRRPHRRGRRPAPQPRQERYGGVGFSRSNSSAALGRYPAPPIDSTVLNSASVTGCTDRRPWRTSAISLSSGARFTSSSGTWRGRG